MALTRTSKFAIVLGGYAAAFAIASACLAAYVAATDTPERVSSSGMYAFGDSMLFLAVFTVASAPATGAALYFLRSQRWFWNAAAVAAVASALIAVAALGEAVWVRSSDTRTAIGMLAAFSPIRILVAPGFALVSLLAAIFSPARRPRLAFIGALLTESCVFATAVVSWVLSVTR